MRNVSFRLTTNPVFEDNPEFLAVPEFATLTDRQMRYVMLVDWYQSPLRLLPLETRKFKAAVMAGYKLEKDRERLDINGRNVIEGKVPSIEKARKKLVEIQYDGERELLKAIDTHIQQVTELLKKPGKSVNELEKANKMVASLPEVLQNRKQILEVLNFRDENTVITSEPNVVEKNITLLDNFNTTTETYGVNQED